MCSLLITSLPELCSSLHSAAATMDGCTTEVLTKQSHHYRELFSSVFVSQLIPHQTQWLRRPKESFGLFVLRYLKLNPENFKHAFSLSRPRAAGSIQASAPELCSDLQMFFPQFSLPPPTRFISVFAGAQTSSFENEGEELYIVPEKGMEITGSVR